MREQLNASVSARAVMGAAAIVEEQVRVKGHFSVKCHDADGNLLWQEEVDNVVCTLGKNAVWDAALAGSSYTVTGPYLGLISSASFSATAAGDTMASHAGWLEAGSTNAPTFTGTRQTCVWSAASAGAKALSAGLAFSMTGTGTVQGCFVVFGTGAVATLLSTAGTLLSAAAFGAAQPVINGNVVTVSYSISM